MKSKICLDTGIVTLYYLGDVPKEIDNLMQDICNGSMIACMPNNLLIETYYHLCKGKGKDFADSCLLSFRIKIPVTFIELSNTLILKAGQLKCRYRNELSYNDCIAIAVSLQESATLCTTEKEFPEIKNLKLKKYRF